MRWAPSLAFSALSWVSYSTSFSLAPPIDLMPPAALMSSIASRAPICSRMPCRAHGPDNGTSIAIFTSAGACARARTEGNAAAPANAARRVSFMGVSPVVKEGQGSALDPQRGAPLWIPIHGGIGGEGASEAVATSVLHPLLLSPQ